MDRLLTLRSRSALCLALTAQMALVGLAFHATPVLGAQAAAAPPALGRDTLPPEWQEGLAALGTGQFQDAFALIHQVARTNADDDRVRHVEKWVTEFETLQQQRSGRARQDYDRYVDWVKEDISKERWQIAILYASRAYNAAEDQDAFRKESWLLKVVAGAEGAAREYEEHAKWLHAARIYVRLMDIFPRKKEYKDALDRCQAHIRLDFTYTPDSDWEATVSNITPDMARDAFRKIESEYITVPDFKDAATAALKHLLLMTEEAKLHKVFTQLDKPELVEEFRDRVGARLKAVEESEEMTAGDLVRHFNKVVEMNNETKLFPSAVLIHEFVHGALRPLDPFSDMLWPSDLEEFNKHTQGHFSGVGISIHKEPGECIKVVSPLEDSPAYNAGIQAGDMITGINGESCNKLTITQAVRQITGPAGTSVTLTIKRPSLEKEWDVRLERQEITIFTIKGFERDEQGKWKYMIDPVNKIGYVRMTNFTEGTIDELRDTIRYLRRQEGMRGLIFDLRGNPGGPLKSAVDVSDLFLEPHKKIVATKDRRQKPWETSSSESDIHFTDFPMIVVVNGSSASASEIVSGALQVHRRALIVGERSFGKGSVQQVLRLNNTNQAFLKLTTAKYYLPNGRCLHREDDATTWGVDPDVVVKLIPKEITKVMELRVNNDVLRGKNQKDFSKDYVKNITAIKPTSKPAPAEGADPEENAADAEEELADKQRPDPNNFPEIDPQLEASLVLMRVRLTSNHPWPMKVVPEVASVKPADKSTR